MKSYKRYTRKTGRVKSRSTQTSPWLEIKLTPGGWEELRRWQRHIFEDFYALSEYPSPKRKRELRGLPNWPEIGKRRKLASSIHSSLWQTVADLHFQRFRVKFDITHPSTHQPFSVGGVPGGHQFFGLTAILHHGLGFKLGRL